MLIPKGGITPPPASLIGLYESQDAAKIVTASLINHCLSNNTNAVIVTPKYCEEAVLLDANIKESLILDMKAVNTELLKAFYWLNEWSSRRGSIRAHVLYLKPYWATPELYWPTRQMIYARCRNLFIDGDPWLEITNKSVVPTNTKEAPSPLKWLYERGTDAELVVASLLNHCYHERTAALALDPLMCWKALSGDKNVKRRVNIQMRDVFQEINKAFFWVNDRCRAAYPSIQHSAFILQPFWIKKLGLPNDANQEAWQIFRERHSHLFSQHVL